MAKPMSPVSQFSEKPQHLRGQTAWYYEEPGGLDVVVESRRADGSVAAPTQIIRIPWRQLRASLKRKDMKAAIRHGTGEK